MENLIELEKIDRSILQILLMDRTTGKNIIWATDSYAHLGPAYKRDKQIFIDHIWNKGVIEPRTQKSLEVQKERTKKNAEVFTPAWICNQMNNQVETSWLSPDSTFTIGISNKWETNKEQIRFQTKAGWKSYVRRRVLEIACGEAPFLVSRYDSSTGDVIPVSERVGLLDRKLRIAAENTRTAEEWFSWVLSGLKKTYGYEFQGDSLLLGRINLFLTVLETMNFFWNKYPELERQKEIATIISWNLFQMDGLTACTPIGTPEDRYIQPKLFDYFEESQDEENTSTPIKINWWDKSKKFQFRDMREGETMGKKFDVVIGNPPYQESDGGNKASAVPVYQKFIEEIKKMSPDLMAVIIPDRWFSGGRGLDAFRESMKSDRHIQYLYDYSNANDCFPGVDISGGICYFIRNLEYFGETLFVNHGKVGEPMLRSLNEFQVVVRSNEAIGILQKVVSKGYRSLGSKVSSQKPFGLRTFVKPEDSGTLTLRWNKGKGPIGRDKITNGLDIISKYKIIVSRVFFEHAGQAGKDGKYRVLSILEELKPDEVCTETYVVVDSFETKTDADNLLKYLKTKFSRFLILQAASSIMITKNSFLFVPSLDFSNESEIDWSKETHDIDKQLSLLFGLTETESNLIEQTIKEME